MGGFEMVTKWIVARTPRGHGRPVVVVFDNKEHADNYARDDTYASVARVDFDVVACNNNDRDEQIIALTRRLYRLEEWVNGFTAFVDDIAPR
jgi:hypothetical protein